MPAGTDRLPYGAQVVQAASLDPGSWLALGESAAVPEARIGELLGGDLGIAAVVPAVHDGGLPNQRIPSSDVVGETGTHLAVRGHVVMQAGLDPYESDPKKVISSLLAQVGRMGLRVVSEPSWVVPGSVGGGGRRELPFRILVATGSLSASHTTSRSRSVWNLVESLAIQARDSDIVVVSAERSLDEDAAGELSSRGVRVIQGPIDWLRLRDEAGGAFSHVVMTAGGAQTGARAWVDWAQPQATKILFLPELPFRQVTALGPMTPPDELAGLTEVRLAVEKSLFDLGTWADAVWCEWEEDVSFVSSTMPLTPVFQIPTALGSPPPAPPAGNRSGVLIVAAEGHDAIACNEDAAVRALAEIMPQLRWRDPEVGCTVISDCPTPMLERAAKEAGAAILPCRELDAAMAGSRVLLAAHAYGSGQIGVILRALELGLPFLATPKAVGSLQLGSLAGLAVREAEADLASRSWQLLSDEQAWSHFVESERQLAAGMYGPDARTEAMRKALAPHGIDGDARASLWPHRGRAEVPAAKHRPEQVAVRPRGTLSEPIHEGLHPATDAERYRYWADRFGPTPEVLTTLRQELAALPSRPLISVLMPVYNTDADVLYEAIDSVRAQIYDHWELCIANDGSRRQDTLAVLDELRSDRAIRVVDIDTSGGISAATNAALSVAVGEYVAFLDHDDLLKPHALAQVVRWIAADPTLDVVYSDEDKVGSDGLLYDPHPKPDWSPDQLMCQNYVSHITVVRRTLLVELGGLRPEYDGSQDHDLLLRIAEVTDRIAHVPEPLYTWRAVEGSAAAQADAKPYAITASQRAISSALLRRGYTGRVDATRVVGCFRPRYDIRGKPRVAIVIPTRDNAALLDRCLTSILKISTYANFEILIIDNDSVEADTLELLAGAPGRVIRYPHRFNYARMMNLAARSVECDALLFLNNDTEVITPSWIEALLEHAMRPEVGVVGGRLYFPDGSAQHEGIMVGIWGGWAGNVDYGGFWNRGDMIRNATAITGACTMIRPSVYWRVGGNDERLRVAYNDVDICMRIRQAGYEVVYTPFAELYHYEGSSRSGYEHPEDGPLFGIRWRPKDSLDPYYSPMLSDRKPFTIRI